MAKKPADQREKPGRKKIKIDYAKAEALAARGMEEKDIALCLGMHATTLCKKKKVDKKLTDAIDRGNAAGIAAVTAQLLKQISLGNMTGIIFYLKCRAHWKETSVLETRNLPPIPDDSCSPEEAEAAYIASMRAHA